MRQQGITFAQVVAQGLKRIRRRSCPVADQTLHDVANECFLAAEGPGFDSKLGASACNSGVQVRVLRHLVVPLVEA